MKKIVIIASTGGAVLSKTLSIESVRRSIFMVVSDRECGAISIAQSFGVRTMVFSEKTVAQFSNVLIDYFKDESINYFLSFYTKLFSAAFVNYFPNKILNFHPSILPACPGLDGFGDTIRSKSKFIGSTLHFVDKGCDTGLSIIQSSFPYQPHLSIEKNRHIVFVQQCKIFIQFIEWVNQDRIVDGNILNAKFILTEFSPNLDSVDALEFNL